MSSSKTDKGSNVKLHCIASVHATKKEREGNGIRLATQKSLGML